MIFFLRNVDIGPNWHNLDLAQSDEIFKSQVIKIRSMLQITSKAENYSIIQIENLILKNKLEAWLTDSATRAPL